MLIARLCLAGMGQQVQDDLAWTSLIPVGHGRKLPSLLRNQPPNSVICKAIKHFLFTLNAEGFLLLPIR